MWFFGLIVVLLIGAVAVVASGRWGAMSPAYDDRPDMTVPVRQALTATEIESVRFAVGLRGYRMDEVDTLLERVAREVAERDRRIADLERAVAPILDSPDGDGFAARTRYTAADFDDTGAQPPILVGGEFPGVRDTAEQPAVPAEAVETTPAPAEAQPAAPAQPASPAAPVAAAPGVTIPVVAVPAAESSQSAPEASAQAPEPPAEAPAAEQAPESAANEYERLQAEARALLEATTGSLPTIRPAAERAAPIARPATPPLATEQSAPEQSTPRAPDALNTPAPAEQGTWFQDEPASPPPAQRTPYQQPANPAPVPHWVQRGENGQQESPAAEQEGRQEWDPPAGDPNAQGRHSAPPEQSAYQRPS